MQKGGLWAIGFFSVWVMIGLSVAVAEDFPNRSLRLVLPFPAGGGSDTIARVTAQKMTALLGQAVVIDNRAGASGNIAADLVARAAADGYTLLFGNSSLAIVPALFKKLSFDPIKDFLPLSMVSSYPFVLVVHPSLPVKNVRELIALGLKQPGSLTYASAGAGTMAQLAMELFRLKTSVRMTHLPFKGAAPQAMGLMIGEAQCGFVVMPVAKAQVRARKLRALAVAAPEPQEALPATPTMIEAGVPGHTALQWNGFFVPAKTPASSVQTLYQAIIQAIHQPDTRQRFEAEGAQPVGSNPVEFTAFFHAEIQKWADVVKRAGSQLD